MDEIEVLVRNAHGRVIQSMGGEAEFDKRVLSQLPLVPTDDHVMAIARPCGWQDEWMMKPTKARVKKAAAKAAASGSGNVVDLLAAVSHEASSHVAPHAEAALHETVVESHGGSSDVPAAGMPASVEPATPVPMAAAPAPVPSTPVPSARHVQSTPMELEPAGPVVPPMTPMSRPPRPAMPRHSESHAPPSMEAVVEAARSKAGFPSYGASNRGGSHDDSHDEPFCLICRSDMHPRSEECEALPCGHAFHMVCLRKWRETCGVRACDCPLKCHQRNDARVHPLFRRSGAAAGSRDGASGGDGEDNSYESDDHRLPDLPHSDNSGGSDHEDEPTYM